MKVGVAFLTIALALLGVAIYLGAYTRADVTQAQREAERLARPNPDRSKIKGAEAVDSQAVGEATTDDDVAEFLKDVSMQQAGTDVPAIEQALANQPIALTPLERRVKDSPVVGHVSEVHLDLGFVVLDSGKDEGLQAGVKLAVRREHHIIGRLVIDTVEDSQSVANLVRDSIPTGIELRDGDAVIPWASK